ncbi:MAG: phosphatidylserine decarboxylase family protein [Desulfomonile sp.]|nr:phosphatidylserine decarboxylase family protein [Desulfomonile sp.]
MTARTGHREPVAREGFPYALPLFVVAAVFWWFEFPTISLLFLALTTATLLFFRNPHRTPPPGNHLVLSPADGTVAQVLDVAHSEDLPAGRFSRISIFMSVFNVHVNRSPVSGTVVKITYRSGRFLDAREEAASTENESNSLVIETDAGTFGVVQVTGLIARRISCWVREGDHLLRGERFGLVHFGSRLDVYLPEGFSPTVKVGTKVRAGTTVIAERRADTQSEAE